jgi:hypothetical protein
MGSLSQALQIRQQVGQRRAIEPRAIGMAEARKHVRQRLGMIVMKVRPALADAQQRRRIEMLHAILVRQANVIRVGGREGWRSMTGLTISRMKHRATAFDRRDIKRLPSAGNRWRR